MITDLLCWVGIHKRRPLTLPWPVAGISGVYCVRCSSVWTSIADHDAVQRWESDNPTPWRDGQ